MFGDEVDVLEAMLRMNKLPEARIARRLSIHREDHSGNGRLNH